MVTTAGVLYVVFGILLFFFWIYGIASFVHDMQHRYIPAIRAWREGEDDDADEQDETAEKMRELYGGSDE